MYGMVEINEQEQKKRKNITGQSVTDTKNI